MGKIIARRKNAASRPHPGHGMWIRGHRAFAGGGVSRGARGPGRRLGGGAGTWRGRMRRRSDWPDASNSSQSDLFSAVSGRFDVLAANLPYIPRGEMATLSREVQRDPVRRAGWRRGGLELIERFVAGAPAFCEPGRADRARTRAGSGRGDRAVARKRGLRRPRARTRPQRPRAILLRCRQKLRVGSV